MRADALLGLSVGRMAPTFFYSVMECRHVGPKIGKSSKMLISETKGSYLYRAKNRKIIQNIDFQNKRILSL